MATLQISPSAGTVNTTFSAIITDFGNLADVTINWGLDSNYNSFLENQTFNFYDAGHYLITVNSCSGVIYNHVSVADLFAEKLNLLFPKVTAYTSCPLSFNVLLSSKEETVTLNFNASGSKSELSRTESFWSHLVPQFKFFDLDFNEITSYTVKNSPVILNNDIIGYSSNNTFYYYDDKPSANISIIVDFMPTSAACSKKDFYIQDYYFSLTPILDYSIAFLADAGIAGATQRSAVSALSSNNPDFWIIGGDNSYNHSSGNLAPFYAALSAFTPFINEKKIARVLGNHDWDSGGIVADNKIFGQDRYFDRVLNDGMVHLFVLDSGYNTALVLQEEDGVTIGSDQYNWFVEKVRLSDAPFKVLAFHHPFVATYSSADSKCIFSNMDWKFENFGIDLILNGHIHSTEILEYKGMTILNCSRTVRSYVTPNMISPYSVYNPGSGKYVSKINFYPTKFEIKILDLVGNTNTTYTKTKAGNGSGVLYTDLNLDSTSNPIEVNEFRGGFTKTKFSFNPYNIFLNKLSLKN